MASKKSERRPPGPLDCAKCGAAKTVTHAVRVGGWVLECSRCGKQTPVSPVVADGAARAPAVPRSLSR